ncbi:MAG: hypothetical protein M3Q22_17920 [Actinomycetota bacterium]|nr:hypothetical protein [Actinomycetota bacterium]
MPTVSHRGLRRRLQALGDITTRVAAWVAQIYRSGKSASTVRHAHRVLSLIPGLAVRDGRLAPNQRPACRCRGGSRSTTWLQPPAGTGWPSCS